ncbi:hypothetical protein CO731_03778 [Aminobacter sp. MSH1]|uniref:Uncharacterized protein n=1 Tax=Aminobacter niigataensis TaxID=83265 RepID=A0ABR6L0G2_9HYPH|nr:hypothetical protein CO731_03778 [Aminobacter sp. MSH1]MBB4649679.1 hypothetical protein [Aminobacter niigataensis]
MILPLPLPRPVGSTTGRLDLKETGAQRNQRSMRSIASIISSWLPA